MKEIIIVLLIFLPLNLVAQKSEKLELSMSCKSIFSISKSEDIYFLGASSGLGYILSPGFVLSGSLTYYTRVYYEDSSEDITSLIGISMNIKRVFSTLDTTINPYLQLGTGIFIPTAEDQFYSVFPELCGSVGIEFLINRNTSIFLDVGYMLVIMSVRSPNLISGSMGVSINI